MTTNRTLGDKVRVEFSDGSSTVFVVLDEEDLLDAIVEMCEREGWDPHEVSDYHIIGAVYADEYGIDRQ